MAERPTHLEIKGWKDFQHYKDRRPPWIKLYASVLDDLAFLQMPEAVQAQLVKLWILASQLGHPLPYDAKLLGGKITAQGRFRLDLLLASGFVIPCYPNASAVLAKAEENARPLVQRAERESRGQRAEERGNPLPTGARVSPLTATPGVALAPEGARSAEQPEPQPRRNGGGPEKLDTILRSLGLPS